MPAIAYTVLSTSRRMAQSIVHRLGRSNDRLLGRLKAHHLDLSRGHRLGRSNDRLLGRSTGLHLDLSRGHRLDRSTALHPGP